MAPGKVIDADVNAPASASNEKAGKRVLNEEMQRRAEIHEYTSSANPPMGLIPVVAHAPELHEEGPTRIEPFDLSTDLKVPYVATSPNLLAAFIRVLTGESITSKALATSQAFYVIRGTGSSESEFGVTNWSEGDLFVLPTTQLPITHTATGGDKGGAALYWVSDEPLMRYLGTLPEEQKFEPTMWTKAALLDRVEEIRHTPGATELNRCGVLLGNTACPQTKTLTHVLWSLLNSLAPHSVQRPHRHNSVSIRRMCVHNSLTSRRECSEILVRRFKAGGLMGTPTAVSQVVNCSGAQAEFGRFIIHPIGRGMRYFRSMRAHCRE